MAQTPNPSATAAAAAAAAAAPAGGATAHAAAAAAAAAPAATSQDPGSHTGAGGKDLPRDARVIGLILASLGVSDAEPGVVAQLLEFAHRYTLDILTSASTYAEHASRPRDATAAGGGAAAGPQSTTSSGAPLDLDDLRLAVSSKLEHSYSSPLPKEFLLPLAATLNRVPLPIIPDSYGIRLPHERERLTAVNWDLKPVKERREYKDSLEEGDSDAKAAHASTSQLGASTVAGEMDVELEGRDDLFGGADDEEEEEDDDDDDDDGNDDDDDDDEEMEDVLGTDGQPQPAGDQAQPGQQDEDAAGEDDDGEDAEGEEAASGEDARGEDDEYDA